MKANGLVVDADAHVIETEHTWDFLDSSDAKYRPDLVSSKDPTRQYWVVDGKIRGVRFPTLSERELASLSDTAGRNMQTLPASRSMDDVSLRVKHLDDLGIDVQVLHNTIWLEQVTDQAKTEVALVYSWNRWMADVWKQGNGRLRWSCVFPVLDMEEAVKELRFAKENGAVAVAVRPFEGERMMIDPYFYPLYEEANRLDMAVAVHIANGNPRLRNLLTTPHIPGTSSFMGVFRIPTVTACYWMLMSEIPKLFPNIRWGFIEASSQWLPWVLQEARTRYKAMGAPMPDDILRRQKIYVTCENDDDLPYLVACGLEDHLVIGTDYGHTDPSSDVDAMGIFQGRNDISEKVKEKILSHNAKALFGL